MARETAAACGKKKLTRIEIPTITTGIAVEFIPSAIPSIIIVALPVFDDSEKAFGSAYMNQMYNIQ